MSRGGSLVAAWLAAHCGDAALPASRALPIYEAPRCAARDEAPYRAEHGAHACRHVGADVSARGATWDESSADASPVVFVRPGAEAPGAGTREAPYADLEAALSASPAPATILVAAGTLALPRALSLAAPTTVRGVGADRTVLEGDAGGGVFVVTGPVTLAGLTVRPRTRPADPLAQAVVAVRGPGASLTLREARVERAATGVEVSEGATLCAERVTIPEASWRAISLAPGSHGYLRDALLRDGAAVGIWSERAHLVAAQTMVAGQGRDGVVVRGALLGDTCARDDDCPPSPGCLGLTHDRACVADRATPPSRRCVSVTSLTELVSLGNGVTAMRAERSSPTTDEVSAGRATAVYAAPGPVVRASRAVLAATVVPPGAVGGDGLYVGATADVTLDVDVRDDSRRGEGSEIVANARAGVMVDGDRPTGAVPPALRVGGVLRAFGSLVGSNEGPGVFVQVQGEVPNIAFAEVADNAALGLGVTSGGHVASIQCNHFISTRLGTLIPEDRGLAPLTVGDGASLAEDSRGASEFVDTELSHNARFGLVLSGADVRIRGETRGVDNLYGAGVQGAGAVLEGSLAAIAGRVSAPAVFVAARGAITPVAP